MRHRRRNDNPAGLRRCLAPHGEHAAGTLNRNLGAPRRSTVHGEHYRPPVGRVVAGRQHREDRDPPTIRKSHLERLRVAPGGRRACSFDGRPLAQDLLEIQKDLARHSGAGRFELFPQRLQRRRRFIVRAPRGNPHELGLPGRQPLLRRCGSAHRHGGENDSGRRTKGSCALRQRHLPVAADHSPCTTTIFRKPSAPGWRPSLICTTNQYTNF